MNALGAYLALRAAAQRRAVPKVTCRHIHLSRRPLVIAGYHLAGDLGAPLALMWGTDLEAPPEVAVVPEPRNRELRFQALARFGSGFVQYLDTFSEIGPASRSRGRDELVYADAPQIIVPNRATADWLFGVVGRFTRHLRTDRNPAPLPIVPRAGMYLSFFHDLLPGSSLVLPATEVLSRHWQTGQLASEDLNLSALLGWIAPGEGADGVAAARQGENRPPAGPLSDPNWDAQDLEVLVRRWHEARTDMARSAVDRELERQIRDQLHHTWDDCWRAHRLLAELPEGESVDRRWARDRRQWTRHHTAMQQGTARFRNIPTPTQSASTLRVLERATTDLKHEMALDDPLVMATFVAAGEALSARVLSVDAARTVPGSRRRLCRPLVTLEALVPYSRPAGTVLFLASMPEVEFEILSASGNVISAQVNRGAVNKNTQSRLPRPSEVVVLSPFDGKREFYPSRQYEEIPWTHRLAESHEELVT